MNKSYDIIFYDSGSHGSQCLEGKENQLVPNLYGYSIWLKNRSHQQQANLI